MLTVPITRVGLVRMCILGLLEDSLRVKSVLDEFFFILNYNATFYNTLTGTQYERIFLFISK